VASIAKFVRDHIYVAEKHGIFNPLNPICHLLALLGAHHILHVSRIRVNVRCGKNVNGKHYEKNYSF
jgi:hypothetical protein